MKKVMAIIFLIGTIGLENAKAQEKTMPTDSTLLRGRTRTETHNIPIPIMDIPLTEKDNTRIDNMRIKEDSTLLEMYQKRMPSKVEPATVNRVDNGRYFWETRQDTALKGMYNGQRIRSDTIRNGAVYNGMRLENIPNRNKKPKNKKEMDGTQNGKYNTEMTRDSMPDGKYGEENRQHINTKNRGVLRQNGKTMIVKEGKMTVIKAYTNLSYGAKVMSDGTIVQKDGTKTQLQEGEFVNMRGEIVQMKQD
jgi:hypothetical protein